jgi:hypothetical protein
MPMDVFASGFVNWRVQTPRRDARTFSPLLPRIGPWQLRRSQIGRLFMEPAKDNKRLSDYPVTNSKGLSLPHVIPHAQRSFPSAG